MPFSTIIGHESTIRGLQRALEASQLAGTYLFVGPQGVGKTSVALAFAGAAACLNPGSDPFDACGECDSCRRQAVGSHPEIVLVSPAGDQTQIWQFWDRDGKPPGALQRSLPYAPVIGRRRVYIVERADTLNEAAANSLLKVLEEPPPYALFILLAPHTSRVLPTILSRAQTVRLAPLSVNDLASYLGDSAGLDSARAIALAAFSEGRPGSALEMAGRPEIETEINRVLDLVQSISRASPLRALKIGEDIRKLSGGIKAATGEQAGGAAAPDDNDDIQPKERSGRRQLGMVLDLLVTVYRDLLSLAAGGPAARIIHTQRAEELTAAAEGGTADRWIRGLDALLVARRRVDQNINPRLLTDWLAIELVAG